MNINTNSWIAPRFTGVHRGRGDSDVSFKHNEQWYHADGEDIDTVKKGKKAFRPLIIGLMVGDTSRSTVGSTPWQPYSALQRQRDIYASLAAKEPNNQFQAALAKRDVSAVWRLLKNPEVRISETDTPGVYGLYLPERLLGNQKNFEYFVEQLGDEQSAEQFITSILATDIAHELAYFFSLGNMKIKEKRVAKRHHWIPKSWTSKRDDKDILKSALELARDAVKEYRGQPSKLNCFG